MVDRILGALSGNDGEGNAQMVNQTKEVSKKLKTFFTKIFFNFKVLFFHKTDDKDGHVADKRYAKFP